MPTHPTAFISYSWDDDTHKVWLRELATQRRADGIEVRLDHWHTVPGDQLPEFMEREIRSNDFVLIICTPKYKAKSDGHIGGVGYEGDIMTAEVLTKQNHRKFIPVLARGTWAESAPSWLSGKRRIDLSDVARFEVGYQELWGAICGKRTQPPPLGPPPPGYPPPAHSRPAEPASKSQHVDLGLFDRRMPIHDAAMRFIAYVVAKGDCPQEVLDQFLKDTKDSRYLFNEDVEGYLRTLANEALWVHLGKQKQESLASTPPSKEFQKSVDAWGSA